MLPHVTVYDAAQKAVKAQVLVNEEGVVTVQLVGAQAGATYFVKVDAETTTQNDINLGIVNVVVGFAPLKPAEFVVITIKQQAGQVQV